MAIRRIGNNKYRIIIEMGHDYLGNRRRKTDTVYGSKQEAILRESELNKEFYHIGKKIEINNLTFREYSELYIKKYGSPNLSLVTISKYEKLLVIINNMIGNIKLSEINSLILDDMFSKLKYGLNGKEVSYNYLYDFYKLIKSMFRKAVNWELINRDPTDKMNNKPKKDFKEKRYYNFNQVNELLNALNKESIKNRALIILALDSGARRSEICSLKWSDIDLDNRIVKISRSLKIVNGVIDEKSTKTLSSNREIIISESTVKILREYKKWQDKQYESMTNIQNNENRVFASMDGKNMNPNSFGNILRKLIKKYNLDPLCFHELRHTNASFLINSGIDAKTVSQRLGHSDVGVTLKVYTHSFETSKLQCAEKFDEMYQNI